MVDQTPEFENDDNRLSLTTFLKECWVKKYFSYILNLCLLFVTLSCGKPADQNREDAVLSANILLSNRECQSAIELLESVGRDTYNAKYMQTLASAYACKAGFAEPAFFVDEIPKIGTPATLGGMTRFALASTMTAPDSDSFTNLQTAIDILLYSGGVSTTVDPTLARRANGLSSEDAQDINAQLMYMLLTQMGMYLYYYGDSSSSGVKGSGPGTNTCLANYSNVALDVGVNLTTALSGGQTGSCVAINTGHASLGAQGSLNVKRMCQGVVLLNNFIEIFPSILSSVTGDDLNTVSGITSAITLAKTAVTTAKTDPQMATLLATLSQEKCEADNASDTQYLQVYFALMYETLFK